MDKTFDFKGKELRLTDANIEIDSRPIQYNELKTVSYKKAKLFRKGELGIKPADDEEETFSFKGVINKQVRQIAEKICEDSGLELKVVK